MQWRSLVDDSGRACRQAMAMRLAYQRIPTRFPQRLLGVGPMNPKVKFRGWVRENGNPMSLYPISALPSMTGPGIYQESFQGNGRTSRHFHHSNPAANCVGIHTQAFPPPAAAFILIASTIDMHTVASLPSDWTCGTIYSTSSCAIMYDAPACFLMLAACSSEQASSSNRGPYITFQIPPAMTWMMKAPLPSF